MVSEVRILEQTPADVPQHINTDRVVCVHRGCNSDTRSGLKTPMCLRCASFQEPGQIPLPGSLAFLLSVLLGHLSLLPSRIFFTLSLCLSDSLCSVLFCLSLSLSFCHYQILPEFLCLWESYSVSLFPSSVGFHLSSVLLFISLVVL